MSEYHKITTMFKRDPDNKFKTLLDGQWATPEFEYLQDDMWECTEKIDGTNIRIIWQDGKLTFGGKTDNAQIPSTLINVLNGMFSPDIMGMVFDGDVCLYGEGYGKGIQKGGRYLSDTVNFILFDVNIGGVWLERENVEDIGRKLNLLVVPMIGTGTLVEVCGIVKRGFLSRIANDATLLAEGLVCRPVVGLTNRMGKRIITKIKSKDFAN